MKRFKTCYKFLYIPLSHLKFKAHTVCNIKALKKYNKYKTRSRKADLTGDTVR